MSLTLGRSPTSWAQLKGRTQHLRVFYLP
jgi:hypothetical protein